jgi:O-antigen ligase
VSNQGIASASAVTSPATNTARWLFAGLLLWSTGVLVNETLASLGVIATGLGVAAIWFQEGAKPRIGERLRAWWPLLLFLAWAIAAPAMAGRLPTATGLARAIDWLLIPFAAYAVRVLPERHRRAIVIAAAVVFLLSCAMAALQHFGRWPSLSTFERFSWTRIPFHRVYEAVPGAQGRFMAGGLLFHRLKFAHVGGLWVLAFLVLGLVARGWVRALALSTSAIGFLSVLVFPYARAASVALLVSGSLGLALIGISRPRVRIAALAIAGLTLAGVSAYRPMRDRFVAGLTSAGSGHRGEILSTGLRAVAEHPIAGLGLGHFRPSYFGSASTPQEVIDNPGKAHNEFLSIAAETGIPGLALFLFLLGWLARSFNPRDPSGVFGLSALTFFFILSLAHDPLIHAPFSMALSLSLGAASARAPMSRR